MIGVTGGAGFIGSALVWALNRAGEDRILIVDDLKSGSKWRNINGLKFIDIVGKDKFIQDVESNHSLGLETVFHMGACSSTIETDGSYLLHNNYEYSKSLATYCLKNKVRFIYASSAATYGSGEHGYDDTCKLRALRPLNIYGYSKHLFDLWIERIGGLEQAVGIKFFNVWGPNEAHKGTMRSVVVKAYEQIKARGVVELFQSHHPKFENGKQMRDFLYVKDAVRMILEIYRRQNIHGIYNLGQGHSMSWIELVTPIFEVLGLEPRIDFIPIPLEIRDQYQYFTQAAMKRYCLTGCPQYKTPLKESINDYVINYLEGDFRLGSHIDQPCN